MLSWKNRYLNALHYGKDGNFNLNHHDKKMDEQDIALTEGAAYYADTAEHENYKAKATGRSELSGEVSRCILYVI